MNKVLSPAERRALKARAHPLKPTVMIGNDGLSASVLQEIDSTLKAHELIKIRVDVEDSDEREDMLGLICANTGSSSIDHIGKILVIYRERPGGGGGGGGGGGNAKAGAGGGRSQQPRKGARNGGGNGQPNANGEGKRKAKSGGGPVWTKARQQRGRKGRPGAKRGPGGQGGGQGGDQGGGNSGA